MTRSRGFSHLFLVALINCASTPSTRTDGDLGPSVSVFGAGHDRVINLRVDEHADGATLLLTSRETCDEQWVRVRHETGGPAIATPGEPIQPGGLPMAISCNEGPVANTGLALGVNNIQGTTKIGSTDKKGLLELRWSTLRPVLISGGGSALATIYLEGGVGSVSFDLSPARRYVAQRVLEEARTLLDTGATAEAAERVKEADLLGADVAATRRDLESARGLELAKEAEARAEKLLAEQDLAGAWAAVARAETWGGEVTTLKARVSDARTKEGERLIADARILLKRNQVGKASEEQRAAKTLGVSDETLDSAIERIEKQREADTRRQQEVQDRRREQEDARLAANRLGTVADEQCPTMFEALITNEGAVSVINDNFATTGGQLSSAQAREVFASMPSRSQFLASCRRRVLEAPRGCTPEIRNRWRPLNRLPLATCYEIRVQQAVARVAFDLCAERAVSSTARTICLLTASGAALAVIKRYD